MSEGLFTDIEAPDADGDAIEGLPAFTPEQYATLERLTRLQALLAVNEVRLEQVTKWGHTDESDANQPIWWHAREANARLSAAIDYLRMGGKDAIPTARKQLLKGLALGLTAIDRLDAILDQLKKEGN
jgi:hypothetical protein